MRVLLTGAFGNIGISTLDALLAANHPVRCFDLPTRANRRAARRYAGRIEMEWGDLRNPNDIHRAVRDRDVVIHLAFIIPKLSATGVGSEIRPDWAHTINVGGTRNLIAACRAQPVAPRIIFSSSLHVYGRTHHLAPPRTIDDPVRPTEHYSRHKVECEEAVRSSGLVYAILRFGAALPLSLKMDPGMFDVPLDNRMEFVHTHDVGLALAHAVESDAIWGRTWLIGGGPSCQLFYRQIVESVLSASGIGMLPDSAFTAQPFPTDWLDTRESQTVLQYQRHDIRDYSVEMAGLLGWRRVVTRAFRPLVRHVLLQRSPFYRHGGDWRGSVALVTGATGGIGSAIARRLAANGLRVALVGRRTDALEQIRESILADGGDALVITTDLAQEGACESIVQQASHAYGRIDVLVNCAGFGWYGYGSEMSKELAQSMMQVNSRVVVDLTLLCLPEMREHGGHIVNISSVAGSLPEQGLALYSATKSFVDSFSTALHRELRGSRVHVGLVRPGPVRTEFFARAAEQPGGRPIPGQSLAVSPEEVADGVWSLLRRPRRVVHIPAYLGLAPWIEPALGWLIDLFGPALLRRVT